ncbi:MAG: hypothetical protein KDC50_04635 [Flavobacterium sp.]|uniref:hypothetical protein n=1 Tax=Flavobacterium sp. TaxID=239 RepID=UPI001D538133|nr:hypothetical protein [Flavobacterium sp.]
MRILVSIVLFLFLSFLSLPTLVGLLDNNDTDISMVYNLSEEEEVLKSYNFKEAIKTSKQVTFICLELVISKKIINDNQEKYDSFLEEIFSPPPEKIIIS